MGRISYSFTLREGVREIQFQSKFDWKAEEQGVKVSDIVRLTVIVITAQYAQNIKY